MRELLHCGDDAVDRLDSVVGARQRARHRLENASTSASASSSRSALGKLAARVPARVRQQPALRPPTGLQRLERLARKIDVVADVLHRRVDLVRDAGGQAADRLELLRQAADSLRACADSTSARRNSVMSVNVPWMCSISPVGDASHDARSEECAAQLAVEAPQLHLALWMLSSDSPIRRCSLSRAPRVRRRTSPKFIVLSCCSDSAPSKASMAGFAARMVPDGAREHHGRRHAGEQFLVMRARSVEGRCARRA